MMSKKIIFYCLLCFSLNSLAAEEWETGFESRDKISQKNYELILPTKPIESRGLKGEESRIKTEVVDTEAVDKHINQNANEVIDLKVTSEGDKLFQVRFNVLHSANLYMDQLVAEIIAFNKSMGVTRIHVVGHTDSDKIIGSKRFKDNYELSQSRAKTVADKLLAYNMGIPLSYDWKGPDQPVASNATAAGKAKNRRTDIHVFFNNGSSEFAKKKEPKQNLQRVIQTYKCLPNEIPVLMREQDLYSGNKLNSTFMGRPVMKQEGDFPDRAVVADYDSFETDYDAEELVQLADFIKVMNEKYRLSKIHIVGHADADKISLERQKIYKDNWELSLARAKKVAQVIYRRFPQIPISFDGKGDSEPKATNSTLTGKAINRRVEILLYYTDVNLKSGMPSNIGRGLSEDKVKEANLNYPLNSPLGPFRVTIDGQNFKDNKDSTNHVDFQRCTDVALEKAKLQVTFSEFDQAKKLSLLPSADKLDKNEASLSLRAYTNYNDYINRAEVRVLKYPVKSNLQEPHSVFPLVKRQSNFLDAEWSPVGSKDVKSGTYAVSLRVYDKNGNFDETKPQLVTVVNPDFEDSDINASWKTIDQINDESFKEHNLNYGENRIAISNIDVSDGGTVTVFGQGIPDTHTPIIMGGVAPLDINGNFVSQQILRSGKNYGIEVLVLDSQQKGIELRRDLHIPANNWQYIGLADVTVGQNFSSGDIEFVTQDLDHYDKQVYVDGRLAFYVKGKIKGKYLLTAQLDTLEDTLENSFSNFLDKDPEKLFRRIDPDKYYPVYGDDSTVVEDTPSQGKFYVKIEEGKNHILWGNFKTLGNSTQLATQSRGLYGLNLHLETKSNHKSGEPKALFDAYAAEPGTVPSREELRATGGSLYYLRHQDIVSGSETVKIIVRDNITGLIEGVKTLTPGSDYTLNNIQGLVVLNDPLLATATNDTVISDNNISGDRVYLAVTYEYTPFFTELDSLALGGRAEAWLGPLKLGVTGSRQKFISVDHELYAADAKLLLGRSSIGLEVAQSKGFNADELNTVDGGYTYNTTAQTADPNKEATAYIAEADFYLFKIANQWVKVGATYSTKEEGFSSPGNLVIRDTQQLNSKIDIPLSRQLALQGKYDFKEEDLFQNHSQASADLIYNPNNNWTVAIGGEIDDIKDTSQGLATTILSQEEGSRTDVGVKVEHRLSAKWDAKVFAQMTLEADNQRSDNDRYGLGLGYKHSSRLSFDAEVSDGDLGFGSSISSKYKYNEKTNFYTSYLLENNRTDDSLLPRTDLQNGQFISGMEYIHSKELTMLYENRYQHGKGNQSGLTNAFGLNWGFKEYWHMGFLTEVGSLESDDKSTITDRESGSISIGYADGTKKWKTAIEARRDSTESALTKTVRKSWLLKNDLGYKFSESFRLKAKLYIAQSDSTGGQYFDGDYIDGVLGLAYRPIENDRWNSLFKLRYFESLPSPGQVDAGGNTPEYRQESWILNTDAIYQLNKKWSVGGKLAYAKRKVQNYRTNGPFFENDAQLFILRLDYHSIYKWDFMAELRSLSLPDIDQSKNGALIGVYKSLSDKNNLKLGVGYNFSDFSDDLTKLDYSYNGWFINFVGAF